MKNFKLDALQFRMMMCSGFVLLIAAGVAFFFRFNQSYWLMLSAFFISQSSRGAPLRYSLQTMVLIFLVLLFAAFLLEFLRHEIVIYLVSGSVFISISYYLFLTRPQIKKNITQFVMIIILLLFAFLLPEQASSDLKENVLAVAIGSVIGILGILIFLRLPVEKMFRKGVLELLEKLSQFSETLTQYFLQDDSVKKTLQQKKIALEEALVSMDVYPEWVYELGFNPGLRAGFRFFLIYLERTIEMYFALHYLSRQEIDKQLRDELRGPIAHAMDKNQELLTILINYFASGHLTETTSNFTSDIVALEEKTRQFIPKNIEFLDISPDYITLAAIIRDIKGIRDTLLQLLAALPHPLQSKTI